jgi:hypothetical protein
LPVTITITVDEATGAAMVSTGVEAPPAAIVGVGEAAAAAPAPALLGGPGDIATETAGDDEGPPPLEPEELGLAAAELGDDAGGPPPEDLVEPSESDAAEAAEPMPIEDLEAAAKPPRARRKKA